MTFKMKKVTQAVVCAAGLMGLSGAAHAVNWLQLQGTEPAYSGARAKLWGFIQPEYQYTSNTGLKGGFFAKQPAVFNQEAPDLSGPSGFNVIRAQLGVRGVAFPLSDKIDYFFLANFGNNGITQPNGHAAQLTDASITLNYIPGARIRVGQFKYPGSEEGMMGIQAFNFVNFSQVTNQMMLERDFAATTGQSPLCFNPKTKAPTGFGTGAANGDITCPGGGVVAAFTANNPVGSVYAFRDTGVQVFDWFNTGSWQTSYAVMVGNGNGLNTNDNNASKDLYLYLSTAKIFGGKGPQTQSWKTYIWWQSGKRTLGVWDQASGGIAGDGSFVQHTFDRKRYGIGTTFNKGKIRAAAEYMRGVGMIFNSTDSGGAPSDTHTLPGGACGGTCGGTYYAGFNILPNETANGWYISGGYEVMPKLWLEARYDRYNRGTSVPTDERDFKTATIGAEYYFNKASKIIVNYEFRKADAPHNPNAQPILDTFDNRFATELLVVF